MTGLSQERIIEIRKAFRRFAIQHKALALRLVDWVEAKIPVLEGNVDEVLAERLEYKKIKEQMDASRRCCFGFYRMLHPGATDTEVQRAIERAK